MRRAALLGALLVLPLLVWGQGIGIDRPPSSSGPQKVIISQYLSWDGIGTADSIAATGNYSVTPDTLRITPPAGSVYRIERMIVYVEDGNGNVGAASYGTATALTNGIQVKQIDSGGVVTDLTGGVPVKSNGQWSALCYDTSILSEGAGNVSIAVRWTFARSGQQVRLDGDQGAELIVILNDNLTALVSHRFMVQGYKEGVQQ